MGPSLAVSLKIDPSEYARSAREVEAGNQKISRSSGRAAKEQAALRSAFEAAVGPLREQRRQLAEVLEVTRRDGRAAEEAARRLQALNLARKAGVGLGTRAGRAIREEVRSLEELKASIRRLQEQKARRKATEAFLRDLKEETVRLRETARAAAKGEKALEELRRAREIQAAVRKAGAAQGSKEAAQIARLVREQQRYRQALGESAGALETLSAVRARVLAAVAAVAAGIGTTVAAARALERVISSTNEEWRGFQSGLTGVGKTADLSGPALAGLGERIRELTRGPGGIPVTREQLLELTQTAGQLGVSGADNLLRFATTVGKLGTASDLAGEEGATALARILNVTGEGVDRVDSLASVLVALGNGFAATESQIARHTGEVARSTAVYEIGSAAAAAFGATLAAFGVQAELSGSAIGRSFRAIETAVRGGGEALDALAEISGASARQLREAWERDPVEAFNLFVRGVGRVAESGGNVAAELARLGLRGEEVLKVLPVLGTRFSELQRAQALAAREMAEGTALQAEFGRAAQDDAARLQLLRNTISDLSLEIGEQAAPAVRRLVEALLDLTASEDALAAARGFGAALGDLVGVIAGVVEHWRLLWEVTKSLSPTAALVAQLADWHKWRAGILQALLDVTEGLGKIGGSVAAAGAVLSAVSPQFASTFLPLQRNVRTANAALDALESTLRGKVAGAMTDWVTAQRESARAGEAAEQAGRGLDESLSGLAGSLSRTARASGDAEETLSALASLAEEARSELARMDGGSDSAATTFLLLARAAGSDLDPALRDLVERLQEVREQARAAAEHVEALGRIDIEPLSVSPASTAIVPLDKERAKLGEQQLKNQERLNRSYEEQLISWRQYLSLLEQVGSREFPDLVDQAEAFRLEMNEAGQALDAFVGVASGLSEAFSGDKGEFSGGSDTLGAFGGAVGGAIAGPTGAALGEALGRALGSTVDKDPQKLSTALVIGFQESFGRGSNLFVDAFSKVGHQLANAAEEAVGALEEILGFETASLPELKIVAQADGNRFHAYVADSVVAITESFEEALAVGIRRSLGRADFRSLEPEFQQAIRASTARTLEGFLADLEVAQQAVTLRMSELEQQMYAQSQSTQALTLDLRRLGLETDVAFSSLVSSWQQLRDDIVGIEQNERDRQLADMQGFNEGLARERRRMEAQIAAWVAELADLSGEIVDSSGNTALEAAEAVGDRLNELAENLGGFSDALGDTSNSAIARVHELERLIAELRGQLGQLPKPIEEEELKPRNRPRRSGPTPAERREQILEEMQNFGLSDFQARAAEIGRQFADLEERILGAGFSAEETARLLGEATEERRRQEMELRRSYYEDAVRSFTSFGQTSQIDAIRKSADAARKAIEEMGFKTFRTKKELEEIAKVEEMRLAQVEHGVLDKLFGYLEDSEEFEEKRKQLAQDKLEIEMAILRAELEALGIWEEYQEVFNRALEEARRALENPPEEEGGSGGGGGGFSGGFSGAFGGGSGLSDAERFLEQIRQMESSSAALNPIEQIQARFSSLAEEAQRLRLPLIGLGVNFGQLLQTIEELEAAEIAAAIEQAMAPLREYRESFEFGEHSSLTSRERVEEAERQFTELVQRIQRNPQDLEALQQLQGVAARYLDEAAQAYRSGGAYQAIRGSVLAILDQVLAGGAITLPMGGTGSGTPGDPTRPGGIDILPGGADLGRLLGGPSRFLPAPLPAVASSPEDALLAELRNLRLEVQALRAERRGDADDAQTARVRALEIQGQQIRETRQIREVTGDGLRKLETTMEETGAERREWERLA